MPDSSCRYALSTLVKSSTTTDKIDKTKIKESKDPNPSKSIQIHPNPSKSIQIHLNPSKSKVGVNPLTSWPSISPLDAFSTTRFQRKSKEGRLGAAGIWWLWWSVGEGHPFGSPNEVHLQKLLLGLVGDTSENGLSSKLPTGNVEDTSHGYENIHRPMPPTDDLFFLA